MTWPDHDPVTHCSKYRLIMTWPDHDPVTHCSKYRLIMTWPDHDPETHWSENLSWLLWPFTALTGIQTYCDDGVVVGERLGGVDRAHVGRVDPTLYQLVDGGCAVVLHQVVRAEPVQRDEQQWPVAAGRWQIHHHTQVYILTSPQYSSVWLLLEDDRFITHIGIHLDLSTIQQCLVTAGRWQIHHTHRYTSWPLHNTAVFGYCWKMTDSSHT